MDVLEIVISFQGLMLLGVYLLIVAVTVKFGSLGGEPSGKRALVTLLVVVTGGVVSLALLYFASLAD